MTNEEILAYEAKIQSQYGGFAPSMIPQMTKIGWSPKEQANILHQFKFESNGIPNRPEDLRYRPEAIVAKFGGRPHFAGMTLDQKLQEAIKVRTQGEVAIANAAYGGYLGNAQNEGYKYRGRGYVQLTGKDNYKQVGDEIGVDLVNNPDLLLTDKSIDERASLAYMKLRQKQFKLNYNELSQVSKAITGESFSTRQKKAAEREIIYLAPDDVSSMRPAEDPQVWADFKSDKISIETYFSRRGY